MILSMSEFSITETFRVEKQSGEELVTEEVIHGKPQLRR